MRKFVKLCSYILVFIFVACEKDAPETLAPVVMVDEAQDITRTTALLSGDIENEDRAEITQIRFLYGKTTDMEQTFTVGSLGNRVTAALTELTPGATYYYCLEARNEQSFVRSTQKTFQTIPNDAPSLGQVKLIGQGPNSGYFQCELIDTGGEPVTTVGFTYQASGKSEQSLETELFGEDLIRGRIINLAEDTRYTVRCYARNTVGQSFSESIELETRSATAILTTAGMLADIIGEEGKYSYTTFSVSGPINGTDIRFLRNMMGRDLYNKETAGRLAQLNLTDASIVEGGLTYNESRYTENDKITYGMFLDCTYLEKVELPETTISIEQDAFKGCANLTTLRLPSLVETMATSGNCVKLVNLEVSEANATFSSEGGVLYNRAKTKLIWYPPGKPDAEFVFPETVTEIGASAFRGCLIQSATLPTNLRQLPTAIFQQCGNLESVVLKEKIELLGEYCFDGCPLRSITVLAEIPPVCRSTTFTGITTESFYKTCIVYVPEVRKSQYRSASYWLEFTYIRSYSP